MSDYVAWWNYHKNARDSLNYYDSRYVYENKQSEIDELQKRIDKSIFILSTIDTHEEAYKAIDMLMRELKGTQK